MSDGQGQLLAVGILFFCFGLVGRDFFFVKCDVESSIWRADAGGKMKDVGVTRGHHVP